MAYRRTAMPKRYSRRLFWRGNFGGQVSSAGPLAVPEGHAYVADNVQLLPRGTITHAPFFDIAYSGSLPSGYVLGLYCTENNIYLRKGNAIVYATTQFDTPPPFTTLISGIPSAYHCATWAYNYGNSIHIMADGVNAIEIMNDNSTPTARNLCIAAPTKAPVLTQGPDGSFSGTYRYRFLYCTSDVMGADKASNASPHSLITVTNKQYVNISKDSEEPNPDTQVTHIHIYRTKSGEEGPYYFVTAVEKSVWLSSGYNDSASDSSIENNQTYSAIYTAVQRPWIVATSYGYTFIAPFNSQTIYYAEPMKPWYFNNSIDAQGGEVKAMIKDPTSNQLLIFTDNTIEALDATVPGFSKTPILYGIGCANPVSVCAAPDGIYFYNTGNVYKLRGLSVETIGEPIQDVLKVVFSYIVDNYHIISPSIAWYPPTNDILLHVVHSIPGGNYTTKTLVWNIDTRSWVMRTDYYALFMVYYITVPPYHFTRPARLWCGVSSAFEPRDVYTQTSGQAGSVNFGKSMIWTSGVLDLGTVAKKRFYNVRILHEKESIGIVRATIYIWNDKAYEGTPFTTMKEISLAGDGYVDIPLTHRGRFIQFSFSSDYLVTLAGFELEYEVLG